MDHFEADVLDSLSAKGIKLVPQVGCSSFRIDLAAVHPKEPGRFVLAIECDGATYHSSYTARDRDRLRQRQLEGLGWTFHRIWSTDWFMRKEEEVTRAVAAFHRAVEKCDQQLNAPGLQTRPQTTANGLVTAGALDNRPARVPPRSPIVPKTSISEYTSWELQQLITWIRSDGRLYTNEELESEMFEALPFNRRGSRIEAALRKAVSLSQT